jgi:hypothetical protein
LALPLPIKSDLLRPLSVLNSIQQGARAYYTDLRHSNDPILAVAAWCALIDLKLISYAEWPQMLAQCGYGAIRSRAFGYFQELKEHTLARQAAETPLTETVDLRQQLMVAEARGDAARMAELHGALYIETGDLQHLLSASEQAEAAGGWRLSLVWALRFLAASPLQPSPVQRLYVVLENSGQPDLLQEVAEVLLARNLHLQMCQVFLAHVALLRGEPERCLERLRSLTDEKLRSDPALITYVGPVRALRASAYEKLGKYREAYEAYRLLQENERAKNIDPEDFVRGIRVRAKLNVPVLPADGFPVVTQMLGFPRSGTTLLENVLAAHPSIETFEEIPDLNVAISRIELVLMGKLPPEPVETTFSAARARFFDELAFHRRKPEATVLVDKMPIRSADAALVTRLFPEWRYIFSIRHPFDVVLSCFKQRFTPNPAMENFRSIDSAIRLYDIVMTEWFKYHTLEDSNVCYVRYDELVTDFDTVSRRVLDFLGVDWDESIRDFSNSAHNRAAKTPSYQKVRQGLSIGVQTQWKNYRFAFQGESSKILAKWAEFFGYSTE